MMDKRIVLYRSISLFLGLCLWVCAAKAQNVTVDASIDSLQLFIGEQAKIKLEVSYDAHRKMRLPIFNDTIITGVEVVDVAKPDTQFLNDKKRLLITQEYIITSFDSALYYLPPFEVFVDDKPYYSQSLALNVLSVPVDTLHPDQFFGPKGIMRPAFAWEDWKMIVWLSLLVVPIVLLIIYLIVRYNDNKPIIKTIKIEPKLPPHQLAMKEIERIKSEKIWQQGDSKTYYTELTDIIRIYIKERFGFNALEMTSSEIIEHLLQEKDHKLIEELKDLFQTADLVKFAKHNPLINEKDMNLVNAIDFINQTKIETDPNIKPQLTELTVEEKRSRRAKISLLIMIAVLCIAAISMLIIVIRDIYNLYF